MKKEVKKITINAYSAKITADIAYVRFTSSVFFPDDEQFDFTFTVNVSRKHILDDYYLYNIVSNSLKNELSKKSDLLMYTDDIVADSVFDFSKKKINKNRIYCDVLEFDKNNGFIKFDLQFFDCNSNIAIHAGNFDTLDMFCTFFKEINLHEKILYVMGIPPRPYI